MGIFRATRHWHFRHFPSVTAISISPIKIRCIIVKCAWIFRCQFWNHRDVLFRILGVNPELAGWREVSSQPWAGIETRKNLWLGKTSLMSLVSCVQMFLLEQIPTDTHPNEYPGGFEYVPKCLSKNLGVEDEPRVALVKGWMVNNVLLVSTWRKKHSHSEEDKTKKGCPRWIQLFFCKELLEFMFYLGMVAMYLYIYTYLMHRSKKIAHQRMALQRLKHTQSLWSKRIAPKISGIAMLEQWKHAIMFGNKDWKGTGFTESST